MIIFNDCFLRLLLFLSPKGLTRFRCEVAPLHDSSHLQTPTAGKRLEGAALRAMSLLTPHGRQDYCTSGPMACLWCYTRAIPSLLAKRRMLPRAPDFFIPVRTMSVFIIYVIEGTDTLIRTREADLVSQLYQPSGVNPSSSSQGTTSEFSLRDDTATTSSTWLQL